MGSAVKWTSKSSFKKPTVLTPLLTICVAKKRFWGFLPILSAFSESESVDISGGTSTADSLYVISETGTVFMVSKGIAGGRNGDEPRDDACEEAKSESI